MTVNLNNIDFKTLCIFTLGIYSVVFYYMKRKLIDPDIAGSNAFIDIYLKQLFFKWIKVIVNGYSLEIYSTICFR